MQIVTRIGILKTKDTLKKFTLHWFGDTTETVEGYDISDAFRKAGYGGGAIRALDYYEETK